MTDLKSLSKIFQLFKADSESPVSGKPNKIINAELHQYGEGNDTQYIMSIYPSNLYLDSIDDTNVFLIVKENGVKSLKKKISMTYEFQYRDQTASYGSGTVLDLYTPKFIGSLCNNNHKGTVELTYTLVITATLKNGNTITWRDDPKITLNPGMKI